MRAAYEEFSTEQREIGRTLVRGTARLCVSPFGRACKGIWPLNTAAELAKRVKCAIRTAEYELAGDREPSGRSIAAVVAAISKWPLNAPDP